MKKLIIILSIIVLTIFVNKEEYVVVPQESLRFRVIPNSNSALDIFIKEEVVNNILKEISIENSLINTKTNIENNLPKVNKIVKSTLKMYNYDKGYNVDYGLNYFPKKIYKDVIYPEGYYDSLVISLGEANGSNFWCVLFPPLCMMENDTNTQDIEYKFKIKEVIESFIE